MWQFHEDSTQLKRMYQFCDALNVMYMTRTYCSLHPLAMPVQLGSHLGCCCLAFLYADSQQLELINICVTRVSAEQYPVLAFCAHTLATDQTTVLC